MDAEMWAISAAVLSAINLPIILTVVFRAGKIVQKVDRLEKDVCLLIKHYYGDTTDTTADRS